MNRPRSRTRLIGATIVLALLAVTATAPTAAVDTPTPTDDASECITEAEAVALFEQVEAFAAGDMDPVEAQQFAEDTAEVADHCGWPTGCGPGTP